MNTPSHPRPSRWLGRLLWLATILMALGAGLAFYGKYCQKATAQLAAAEAAVDAVDPRWRLADLEADRAVIPDEQNGALIVLAAAGSRPRPWAVNPNPIPYDLRPVERLTAEQTAWLKAALEKVKPSLEKARKLVGYPTGRFPIQYSNDWVGTITIHRDDVEWTAELLDRDVEVQTQEQDFSGAMRSLLALVNAGRSLGDESGYGAQIVRTRVLIRALVMADRLLAQGQAEDRDLAAWQRLLEMELNHPALEISLRGDRAGCHRWLQAIESGLGTPIPSAGGFRSGIVAEFNRAVILPTQAKYDHAKFLADMTAQCDKARIPWEERPGPWVKQGGLLFHGPESIAEALQDIGSNPLIIFHSAQAQLRCGIVMVAAERFRLAHGRWPESTVELTPEFLVQPLADPYLGGPLLLKRLSDGLVIYSKGFNGVDDGGGITWQETGFQEGSLIRDFGYRLWDVKHRRQPPPLPKPQEDHPVP